MRFVAGVCAALFLLASAPVFAQGWAEYRNTEEGFLVNMPGEPRSETIRYTTQSGASVPARLFFAPDGMNRYTMTVVNLSSSAVDDDGTKAMAYEASQLRRRGQIRHRCRSSQNRGQSPAAKAQLARIFNKSLNRQF